MCLHGETKIEEDGRCAIKFYPTPEQAKEYLELYSHDTRIAPPAPAPLVLMPPPAPTCTEPVPAAEAPATANVEVVAPAVEASQSPAA